MTHDSNVGSSATNKIIWRIIPFICILYMFNIIDRANVGFARLTMNRDVGITEAVIDWGYGLFYLGYLVFEVPSNLMLRRFGARVWISRIMVSWGLVSMLTMFVTDSNTYYAVRILLGIAEAGFFPGIIFYLTAWFPDAKRARVIAWFMLAIPAANVIGNPISGFIMDGFNGYMGLAGWKWLFLLEGFPSVALGILVLRVLPDRPRDASWLNKNEIQWIEEKIEVESSTRKRAGGKDQLAALADLRVWLLIGLYLSVAVGTNATGAYLPKLVKGLFEYSTSDGVSNTVSGSLMVVGLLSALPHLSSVFSMLIASWVSDRWRMRGYIISVALGIAAIGWLMAWKLSNPWLALTGLCLAQAGMMAVLPVFWALPSLFLGGAAAAAGIALINSVANIGSIFAPRIIGEWGLGPMVLAMIWGVLMAVLSNWFVEHKFSVLSHDSLNEKEKDNDQSTV
jgi:MFS family permease